MVISGKNIDEIRKKYNLTQENLAKILGVSPRTVQNWEAGSKIPKTKHEILRSMLGEKKEILKTLDIDNIEHNSMKDNNISTLISILNDTLKEKDKQIDRLLSIIENVNK
ncbi:MAG: helix-turn-helix domain-containing protein [Bacteroidales bacterium]